MNFTENLDRTGDLLLLFIYEQVKETILNS